MKGSIKKFLLSLLLGKQTRQILWEALIYSHSVYERRKNVEGQVKTLAAINLLEIPLGISKQTYTKEELKSIIDKSSDAISLKMNEIAKSQYSKGFDNGLRAGLQEQANITPRPEFVKETIVEEQLSDELKKVLEQIKKENPESEVVITRLEACDGNCEDCKMEADIFPKKMADEDVIEKDADAPNYEADIATTPAAETLEEKSVYFDDLRKYALENTEYPHWSFQYEGVPVTHENDDSYLFGAHGVKVMRNGDAVHWSKPDGSDAH